MNRFRTARILRRTPGEAAFDRCFFPLAVLFVLGVLAIALAVAFSSPPRTRSESELAAAVPVHMSLLDWPFSGLFVLGLVIAFFCIRAFVGVVRVWHDPSARILRYSALGLLIPQVYVAVRLLRLPFD